MSARLTGTLEIMPFLDVLYLLYTNSRTGILRLMAPDGRTGSVFLYNGRFLHAETPNSNGERALAEIVCWPKGAFSFTENERPAVASITRPADEVLAFISELHNQWQSVQHIVKDPLAKPTVNPGRGVGSRGRETGDDRDDSPSSVVDVSKRRSCAEASSEERRTRSRPS